MTDLPSVEQLILRLRLSPHPEGGYYRETYRSRIEIPHAELPEGFTGPRDLMTSIHFLLPASERSRFHRIRSDEIWYHHHGVPLRTYRLDPDGALAEHLLDGLESPSVLFPAGTWMAAEPEGDSGHALVSCAVAPGFDFDDFEMADLEALLRAFPEHETLLRRFT